MLALRGHNVSFRAHASDSGIGSIWTGGVSGQGVELHGYFDWSVLSPNATSDMDYCASPALLGDKKRVAEHADTDDHGDDSHDALERAVAAIRAADAQRARRLTREKGP